MGCTLIPLSIDDGIATERGAGIACMTVPWLFFMGFVITFSALFSKLWRINKIFQQSNFKKIKVQARDVMIPFAVLFSLNFVFLLCWTLVDPIKWERKKTGRLGNWGDSYGRCYCEGQAWIAFLVLIAAVNISALVLACVEAYRARDINDVYSETKYITVAVVAIFQIFVLGIPIIALTNSNNDETHVSYVVRCLLVFLVSMSVLLLMFVPKMRIKKNSKRDQAKKKEESLDRVMKNAAMGVNKATKQSKPEHSAASEDTNETSEMGMIHFNKSFIKVQLEQSQGEAE
eukprot:CAMPEP_0113582996 /NCGR_PEP_ID=MMETSP0015_2-20120614/32248_1 /TAXON_ID=2838 /ORGANISM="Odontella" /LENGTH=287 /DNA_ID=CAMNT_0000487777 /DNA_START=121 /DNA_END=981 /DNA_ORIENTATION=- /assembly_acc=CAM_ASM_000160